VTDAQLWALVPMIALAFVLLLALLFYRTFVRLFGVVIVPEDSVGVVNKKYVVVGQNRTLPAGAISDSNSLISVLLANMIQESRTKRSQ
jgi:hypothetical protein